MNVRMFLMPLVILSLMNFSPSALANGQEETRENYSFDKVLKNEENQEQQQQLELYLENKILTEDDFLSRFGENGIYQEVQCLSLSGSSFHPEWLKYLPKSIKSLKLRHVKMTSFREDGFEDECTMKIKMLRILGKTLPNLKFLDISFSDLGAEGACHIVKNLKSLTSLNIAANKIGDKGARFIADLRALTSLDIAANKIGDEGTYHIAENLKSLSFLNIDSNKISDEGARVIAENLKSLIFLGIDNNQISAEGAPHLAEHLRSLKSLSINSCKVGDDEAAKILDFLKSFNISSNHVSPLGAEQRAKLFSLKSSDISQNELRDSGAKQDSDPISLKSSVTERVNLLKNSTIEISKTTSLRDLDPSINLSLREKNEDNPSNTDEPSQSSNSLGQAPFIKTEEIKLVPEVSTAHVRFLESMSREKIEEIASSLRQTSSAQRNCVHLAYAMIQYFFEMTIPEFVSEEDCGDLDIYCVDFKWNENPSVIKSEEGAPARPKKKNKGSKKRRRASKRRYVTQSKVVNAGPFEQLMPAQKIIELTLDEEGEVIETRTVYDFGAYSQMRSHYSEISAKLKEIAAGKPTVKVSFGKVNLARINTGEAGHMLTYFATPDSVWYIDLQQINEGIGRAVYDSLDKMFDFYSEKVHRNRNTQNVFSPFVFFVPLGP